MLIYSIVEFDYLPPLHFGYLLVELFLVLRAILKLKYYFKYKFTFRFSII
jgi:hypothetical protein